LDGIIWYAYLLLLIAISFVNDYYSNEKWLYISVCVFSLCGLAILAAIHGGRCNWFALVRAKSAILILALILLLLVLQVSISVGGHTEQLLFSNSLITGVAPDWFQPRSLWSVVPDKTRWLLYSEILIFSLFILSISLVASRRRLKELLTILFLVGLSHSLIGIVAKYSGIALVDLKQLDGHFSAARGWFINRNHFAAFIGMCMAGGLAFQLKILLSQRRAKFASVLTYQFFSYRIIFPIGLIVAMIALVLSQSRAGFLAFILPVLLLGALWARVKVGDNRRSNWLNRALPIFVAAVVLLVLVYFGSELLSRFTSDSLLGERITQWSLTWTAIKQSWLLGYGGNSYADVFQVFRGYQDFRQVLYNQAHNDYLHIWLEQGLLGLVLWLSLIVVILRSAYRSMNNTVSTLTQATMVSVLLVMFAALAQSIVDFNLQILNIRYYFFVIMSLAFSVPAISRYRRDSASESSFLE